MENREGALAFDVLIRDNNIDQMLSKDEQRIAQFTENVEDNSDSIVNSFGNIGKAVGGIAIGAMLKSWVTDIVNVRGEFQQLEIAFTTILGSGERATSLMQQITNTAATTPFDLKGVANGAKQLLAYGESADTVNETLIKLGDIASGLSIPLNDIVYLYGTTMVQGRLFAQDVRQFMGRGIPLVQELAKSLGKTTDEINQMVTDGKIGFPEVQKVIDNLTASGGMFYNLMEEQSKSLTGQIANLGDAWDMMLNDIGKSNEGVLSSGISLATTLVENYDTVLNILESIIVTYGTYKAALIATAAVQTASIHMAYATETKLLADLLPMKERFINADIRAAVASGKLTKKEGEKIIAIRAEVAAKLDVLKVNKASALSELETARTSRIATLNRHIDAKKVLAAKQAEYVQLMKNGYVGKLEAAQSEIIAAKKEVETAAIAKNTSAKQLAIARSKVSSASIAVETLQTNISTVANERNAVSTNILAVAKTKLIAITKKLYATMMAHPWALAIAAVAALGYGIYKLVTHQTEAEKAQKRLNDALKEASQSSLAEERELARLKGELDATTKYTDEYKRIKDEIVSKYGQYRKNLDDEIGKVGLLKSTYDELTSAIRASFGARQYEKFAQQESATLDNVMNENFGKIQDRLIEKLGDETGKKIYTKIRNAIVSGTDISIQGFEVKSGLDKDVKDALNEISGKADNKWIQNHAIEGYINDIIQAQRETKKLDELAKNKFGIGETDETPQPTAKEIPVIKTFDDQLNEAKKNVKDFKKELANLFKGLHADGTSLEQGETFDFLQAIEDKKKEIKEAEKARDTLSNYDPKNASKREKEALKRMADYKKESDEYQKYVIDKDKQAQLDIEQARIDAMEEGYDKELTQIDQNYNKMIAENEKRQEELIKRLTDKKEAEWLAQNSNKDKSGFQFTMTDDENAEMQNYLAQYTQIAEDYKTNAEAGLLKKLLDKYKGYNEQRVDIDKKYTNDAEVINNDKLLSDTARLEKLAELEKQRKAEIQNVNNNEIEDAQKTNDLLVKLFEDTTNKSLSEINKIMAAAEQLTDYLTNTKTEDITPQTFGAFDFSTSQLCSLKESAKDIKEIQDAIKKLYDAGVKRNPFEALTKGIKELFSSGKNDDEVIKTKLAKIGEAASQCANMIGDVAGNLSKMFEAAGNQDIAESLSTVQGVMDSVSNIGEGFAKGGIIGGIGAAIGEAAKWATQAFEAEARHKEALKAIMNEKIAQQRAYNLLLLEQNLLYEKGTTIFGVDAYGKAANAVKVMKEAIADLNSELVGTDAQKNAQNRSVSGLFGRMSSLNDTNDAIKKAYAGLADIEIKTGHQKTGLFGWGKGKDTYSSILSIYPELIDANGKFNASLAETILQTRTISDEDKVVLQNMIDLGEIAEEAFNAIKDYLTGIFGDLGNSMSNALVDAFKNGTDAADAFKDSVSDMLEQLAEQMIYSVTLAPLFEKAQEQMLAIMNNGNLTDEQKFQAYSKTLSALMNEAIGEQNKAKELYNAYQKMAADNGIDIFAPDEDKKDDTLEGQIKGVTEETASKLGGEIMAIRIRQAEHLIVSQDIRSATYNMRDVMRDSLLQLQTIANNTSYNKKLVDIDAGIKELSSKLSSDSLRAKGYDL